MGCAGAPEPAPTPPEAGPGYPTELVAPAALPGDWVLEQEVEVTHAEGTNTFRGVVQKRGDELVLLVLGPASRPALTLTQRRTDVEVALHAPVRLPFPARYMLHDVQRAWLRPAVAPAAERVVSGEHVRETWADGRLTSRRFERVDGQPAGILEVSYAGGLAPGAMVPGETWAPPAEATLVNGWFGYTLRIRNVAAHPLAGAASSDEGSDAR
ncbi:MAG: DUF3261 domain-containing protein [Myxococcota bacterium]